MLERRHSKKRDAVLEFIRSSTIHPTAKRVYEQLKPRLPDLSLGTVYRNIKVLKDEGHLSSAGIVQGEERFEGNPDPHPHAVCKCCGLIIDVPPDEKAATGVWHSVSIPGFTADFRDTVFYGSCSLCTKTTTLGR